MHDYSLNYIIRKSYLTSGLCNPEVFFQMSFQIIYSRNYSMEVTQEGQKCIFMLCTEVAEENMEVQEEKVKILLFNFVIYLTWS